MGILVLGASGQLARQLRELMPDADFRGRDMLDLADIEALEAALVAARPRAIINTAAYTAVDAAERDATAAWRLNAEAPAAIARAAAAVDAALVQISSDHVFDGWAAVPYPVDAPVNPLSVYGASKLAGELAVRHLCPRHWILRTSWLFSAFGSNFVKTVLRLAVSGRPLRIVADQFGRPTYAGHLAELIAAIDVASPSPRLAHGVYHATGGPIVSWHEFAVRIVEESLSLGLLDGAVRVDAITTAEFRAAARRPPFGALAPSEELQGRFGMTFQWPLGLRKTLMRHAKWRSDHDGR